MGRDSAEQQIRPQEINVGDVLLIPAIDPASPVRVEQIIAPHSDAGPCVRVSLPQSPCGENTREVIVPWQAKVLRLSVGDQSAVGTDTVLDTLGERHTMPNCRSK